MAAVQRTAEVDWTGSIARGSGHASGGSGALGDLPITVRNCPVSRALSGVRIDLEATLE